MCIQLKYSHNPLPLAAIEFRLMLLNRLLKSHLQAFTLTQHLGKIIQLVFVLFVFMQSVYAAPPQIVGHISFARGSNAAQTAGSSPRILAQGADIYQGDNLQTSERSFVIIEFTDGSKVTIRPNSSFTIDHFDSKNAKMTLHEGGVRASTGDIAKNRPDNFQIKTDKATVSAQQADYSVRLCEQDCQQEQNRIPNPVVTNTNQSVIARVVDVKGIVSAINRADKNAKVRQLSIGAPLYSTDFVKSQQNSYALMVFKDGGKITLDPASEMDIAKYHYQQQTDKDEALYRLTTGGMRVLTGKIGKPNKPAFSVDTPVATIGIRGTGFDLSCVGDCIDEKAKIYKLQPDKIQQGLKQGLYSYVWQGEISQTNEKGLFILSTNHSNYTANRDSEPYSLPEQADMFQNNTSPRPDKDKSSLYQLFSVQDKQGTPSGLYVLVHNGHIELNAENTNSRVDLGRDEEGYVNPEGIMMRLTAQQAFQVQDNYPLPSDFDGHKMYIGIYSLLMDEYNVNEQKYFQCVTY